MAVKPTSKPARDALITELYRGVFGREPDPSGLEHHSQLLADGAPLSQLIDGFLHSEEYAGRQGAAVSSVVWDHAPKLRIDLNLDADQMDRLWRHVAATWTRLGQDDPYWSVLTDPRFHLPNMDDAAVLELFYNSGRGDLERLEAWLHRSGFVLRPDMVCAEYGCGVGRLTGWFAERCTRLRAFDISPAHLRRAAQWVQSRGVTNVDFCQVRHPADLGRLAGIDLFFSLIVLQHNPPPIIQTILGQAFRHLNPGGFAFFQVPTYCNGYSFDLEHYLGGLDATRGMEMHVLPQQDIFRLAQRHGLVLQDMHEDDWTAGFGVSHTLLFRKPPVVIV